MKNKINYKKHIDKYGIDMLLYIQQITKPIARQTRAVSDW